MDNFMEVLVRSGLDPAFMPDEKVIQLDFQYEYDWGDGLRSLLDDLNQNLAGGRLSEASLDIIEMAAEGQPTQQLKIQTAIHLILESPEFVTYH